MKNKLIKKHKLGSDVKSLLITDSLRNLNVRPVPSIITKSCKKKIGVPKTIEI